MANPTGFLDIARRDRAYAPTREARLKSWGEFCPAPLPMAGTVGDRRPAAWAAASPFCHTGCPVR